MVATDVPVTIGDVRGVDMDAQSRCAHFHGPTDIVAIKMKCCGVYYACKDCHEALADHDAGVWPAEEWDQPAIRCGACGVELTIRAYVDSGAQCPACHAAFNPKCRNHYHFYFQIASSDARMLIPISHEPGYWTRPDARSLTLAQFTDIELPRMNAVPRIPVAGRYKPGRLLRYMLDHKDELNIPRGLWLEFGVWSGSSINTIAEHTRRPVFGFDSFQGLPEDWDRGFGEFEKASAFDRGGVMPEVADNVVLIKGWFDQTLPHFLQIAHEPVAFMHVDCDLYSSTKTIFDALGARLQPGTIIVFDELVSYTSWEQGEWKALYELCMRTGMQFDWIGKIGDIIRHFDEFISIKDVRERYGVDPEAALIVREPGRPST